MSASARARVAALALAVTAVLATAAAPPTAAEAAPTTAGTWTATDEVTQLSGDDAGTADDPIATAIAVNRLAHADGSADEVLLGRADEFADTLAAGSATGRPVVLTPSDGLADATAEELTRLGARHVTILGGAEAVATSVEDELAALGLEVAREGGATRIETAVALAEREHPVTADAPVVLARAFGDGTQAFADALGGTALAHAVEGPLLLTRTDELPEPVASYLVSADAREVVIAGGEAAVGAAVEAEIEALGITTRRAAGSDRAGTAVAQNGVRGLAHGRDANEVLLIDGRHPHAWAAGLPAGAWAAGTHTAVALARGDRLTPETEAYLANAPGTRLVCAPGVSATACDTASRALRLPGFAGAGNVALRQPSAAVELIGYHEATHPGAQQLQPHDGAPRSLTMDSRGRDTPSRSAADVVVDPRLPVRAPVTGEVVRAGSYQLYCRYHDEFVVIEPDGVADREVKLLHVVGVSVAPGDRVEATDVVADRSRSFPFRSQVDRLSGPDDWPHVHVEIVDTTVPRPPSSGC